MRVAKNMGLILVQYLTLSVVTLLTLAATPLPADRGLEIAKTMRERNRGFGDYASNMEMVLISSTGKEISRRLRVKVLEVKNDGDKSLAIFDAPADVKGTAFLSHTHISTDDDQWLYLPALRRVKRIAPANKTAPFMGSEFSYEDLASQEVEKYTYIYDGETQWQGRSTFLLTRIPTDKHSGYSKQKVWVDQQRYTALKTEYFNHRGEKVKTLISSQFKQYLGHYWRAGEMKMENHQSGKRSVLRWKDYRFRQKLNEQDFLPASLKRIR